MKTPAKRLASLLSLLLFFIAINVSGQSIAKQTNSNYGKTLIVSIVGFSDNLPGYVAMQKITESDFKLIQQKPFDNMTAVEKSRINKIRSTIPVLDPCTVLQKVLPKSDIEKYLSGEYTQIGGFLTTAKDAKHLVTFADIYYGMRLDYPGTNFILSDGSCGVIRYKCSNAYAIIIPKCPANGGTETSAPPFTGHGFTSGSNGRLGVPEWKSGYFTPDDGAELWEVFADGSEVLRARFYISQNKFISEE